MSAYGQQQQGKAQQAIMNYNAGMQEVAADQAVQKGAAAADVQRAKVRQIIGTQRALMGASGVDIGTGTTGQVLDQTAGMGEQDARQIERNAQLEAWGLRSGAAGQRFQGDSAATAGLYGAMGTLLTGSANAYGLYKRPK